MQAAGLCSARSTNMVRAVGACFHIHSICRDAYYAALVVAVLPAKQLQQVSMLLVSPSPHQYAALKQHLIAKDTLFFQDQSERCMDLPPLRPGDNPWVRATFIRKMPEDLRMMLLAQPNCTLEQLAVFFSDTLSVSLSAKRKSAASVFSMAVDATSLQDVGDTSSPIPVLAVCALSGQGRPA